MTSKKQDPTQPTSTKNTHTKVWNTDLALDQLNGDRDLLDKIVALYIDKVDEIFIELEYFIEHQHSKNIFPLAHDLKDLSRSVGATNIATLAKTLEERYDTTSHEELFHLYRQLTEEFTAFKKIVNPD